ncbi:uncharacterized protein N7529_010365 [Penicillium soppii]|uniref:uncharacterized protein n=1 Tax=Penicillium soppii TaxID=69789 RepID=UPI0025492696|nr:uncharacterized protein N7529_010365 [Penicillium soppii]KAJ5856421.1 hypothetical protein N7529_010365 [Penicillium soppii]
MALDALSTEILLTIFEYLSPLDLYCAIRASRAIYRTFIAYKHHLLHHTLREAIHPACRADTYTALDAQNIPRLIRSGETIAKVKLECFSVFSSDRSRRRQNHDEFKLDDTKLDTLFSLHVTIERLIDSYCLWATGNLSSREKPALLQTTFTHQRTNLSFTERGRLQRAFYRCELYTRFQHVLSKLDKGAALNFSQIILSFVSQFTLYEFEELVSVQQFLAQYIRSLCKKVEDDLFSHIQSNSVDVGIAQGIPLDDAKKPQNVSKLLDDCGLSFFTKSYRELYLSGHVKLLISCGLPYILSLGLMKPQKLKQAILKLDMDSPESTATDFFSQGGLDIDSCGEEQKNILLRGKLVNITHDRIDGPNLGWVWGSSFQDSIKPDTPAMFDLRDRGYVFWDKERLEKSGLVSEPFVVPVGANYFPLGHHDPFVRPSVEERLNGLEVNLEVLRKWKDE